MRATIAAVGRALMTLGLLILLFVGYQLWGTGIFQARAQDRLARELSSLLDATSTTTTSTTTTSTTTAVHRGTSTTSSVESTPTTAGPATSTPVTAAPVSIPVIALGDPIATIQIPKIGLDSVVVQGTARNELKLGPGHYAATPLPGQVGNSAIAGHRTTHGAPFNRLDELEKGDLIRTRSLVGRSVYIVDAILVVAPTDVSVVANTDDSWLTLTTCNPEFSARQRLVVRAKMVEARSDPPSQPARTGGASPGGGAGAAALASDQSLAAGLSGETGSRAPAALWGLLAAITGLAWLWAFRRWRHPATWIGGAIPFLAVLFVFYVYLERMLPAGY